MLPDGSRSERQASAAPPGESTPIVDTATTLASDTFTQVQVSEPAAEESCGDTIAVPDQGLEVRWPPMSGQPWGLFKREREGLAARETSPRFRADAVARPRVARL